MSEGLFIQLRKPRSTVVHFGSRRANFAETRCGLTVRLPSPDVENFETIRQARETATCRRCLA